MERERQKFDIAEIRVGESSMGGYKLMFVLTDGSGLKMKFHDSELYNWAIQEKGNLPKLKEIFHEQIESILRENPQVYYDLSKEKEMFKILLEDDSNDLEGYLRDVFGLLHDEATKRNIEFNGYFQTKWEESSNTITNFDEEYFADMDRRNLYVYKSAYLNSDILELLQYAYQIADLEIPQMYDVSAKIFELETVKGVTF